MTLSELYQRKAEILTAIQKIEKEGQEYRIGDRWMKRADLPALYKQLQEINSQIQRIESGGTFTFVRFSG
ncbi:hypothetical protein SAMN06269117_11454 [Balnearium lithotrophicum]|uniref:GpW protein n=1 Tax=Balnearium lithotrophicum TaxID=223788 RepID=A0A521CSU3_9BACT|nr:peptidylprolyl isomerase [Balnearium lithotrophicum]SMO61791.1 hypothetical protein SAMN06269117_11454 [Balnearium lithotrophicum]